jgi:hypothetical protein
MSDTFKPYDTRDELKQTGVRFTEAEREVIEAAAKKNNVTMAHLIRQATMWAIERMEN